MHCPEESKINSILDGAGLKRLLFLTLQYQVCIHTCQDYRYVLFRPCFSSSTVFSTLLRGFLTLTEGAKSVPHLWFTSTFVRIMLCTAEMVWPLTREDQQSSPEMCPEARKSCTITHFALSVYKLFLLFTTYRLLLLIFPTWNRKVRSKLESADTGNANAGKNKLTSMSITEITTREDTNSLKFLDRWRWWDSLQTLLC